MRLAVDLQSSPVADGEDRLQGIQVEEVSPDFSEIATLPSVATAKFLIICEDCFDKSHDYGSQWGLT